MRLLIATRNSGKVREFSTMLGKSRFDLLDLSAFPEAGDVEETGHTFTRNACIKASEYARRTDSWSLADDSGLEIDALSRAPGVLSARWAAVCKTGAGDADNNRTVLEQLADVPDDRRGARFVCVLALSDPRGRVILTARGELTGQILRESHGTNGFGYDPLFWVPALRKTTAELSPEQKHQISHRGKALSRLRELIDRLELA